MSAFHERLARLRTAKQVTQKEIAAAVNVTPQAMSNIFNGREPDYDTLIKLANFFEVSIDYMLGHESDTDFTSLGLEPETVSRLRFFAEYSGMGGNGEVDFADCTRFINSLIQTQYFEYFAEICEQFLSARGYPDEITEAVNAAIDSIPHISAGSGALTYEILDVILDRGIMKALREALYEIIDTRTDRDYLIDR